MVHTKSPSELHTQAIAEADAKYPLNANVAKAYRIARYNELMVHHGHVIIRKE